MLTKEPIDVLHYMFFRGGGIGRYLNELLKAQVELGFDQIELVCSPEFDYLQSAEYPTWPRLMPLGSRIPPFRRARFLAGQFVSPNRLLSRARVVRPKIIHFSNINHLSYFAWRSRLLRLNARIVATAHDVRRSTSVINRRFEDHWLKQFYRDCDTILVHSQEQVDDLLVFAGIDPARVHIVPHGPYEYPSATADRDSLRQRYSIPLDRFVGLFFGFIRDDKNLEGLIRSLEHCEPRPFLLVAGSGGAKGNRPVSWYRNLVGELGLESDVQIIDRFIPDQEVGDLYEVADFSALTYSQAFSSQSGVLNVAANYRKPVVVTPSPTLAATVRNSGIGEVCSSAQPEAIADGVQRLLPRLDEEWNTVFDRYLADYSWRENAARTAQVYRQLLETASASAFR